ncbi:hypothetical protein [Luedemannella helvata]|uniref:Extracellular repeat, HAF family n=1 Tax=Luedemannella helvata TaxID=349315 RepID=A0ABN2JWQ3_9ACTN
MPMSLSRLTAMAVTLTAVLVASAAPAQAQAVAPTVLRMVDLGTLGGESSYAIAMNDLGEVVGNSATVDGSWHGFVWREGRMTDLGALEPADINNKGQIAGQLDGVAVVWTEGRVTTIGTFGGTYSRPISINDKGHVVGVAATGDGSTVPFLWRHGTLTRLPLDDVSDLNDKGVVSGGRLVEGGFHAGTWRGGAVTDLGAGAFNRSNTYGINEKGWVIGWVFSAGQRERGALWRGGELTDVGTLGGDTTHLIAINDRGRVLATSQLADGGVHPASWYRGAWTDLTTRGVNSEADLVDLNDNGQIAGAYRPVFGISHAIIYT